MAKISDNLYDVLLKDDQNRVLALIDERKRIGVYQLSKELSLPIGKTHSIIRALVKRKLVKTEVKLIGNRAKKFVELK